jgi:hypothetical protein
MLKSPLSEATPTPSLHVSPRMLVSWNSEAGMLFIVIVPIESRVLMEKQESPQNWNSVESL